MTRWRTWRAAMADALYGERGFYREAGAPGRHFRTSASASGLWAAALTRLVEQVDTSLGEPEGFTVVDMGAGGGALAAGIAAAAPPRWRIVGVDVADRPPEVPDRIEWRAAPPAGFVGVLLAVEWLDVVPLDVVEATEDGLALVEVADDGTERLGRPPDPRDAAWQRRWWPLAEPGDRSEIGRSRDEAWARAVEGLNAGAALAVDYAAVPSRDVAGTLTGYRSGRQVAPVPDGTCDLTAHVLLESCAQAAAGPTTLLSQRAALHRLGVDASRPSYDGDPAAYLEALSATGDAAELTDPAGFGGFTWLVQAKRTVLPL